MNKKALKEELTKLQKQNEKIIEKCELEVRELYEVEDTEFNSNLARMQEIRDLLDEKNLNGSTKIVHNGGTNMENMMQEKREFFKKIATEGKIVIEERGMQNQTGGEGNQSFAQTVPQHLMNEVIKRLKENGTIAKDVSIMNVKGNVTIFEEAEETGYSPMLAENEAIPEADLTRLNTITLSTKRTGDCIVVSDQLLINSSVVAENMIIDNMVRKLENTLTKQVTKGTGVDKELKGIMTLKDDEVVGFVGTDDILDDMLEATTDLNEIYLKGAKFYLNRPLFKKLAKMKNATGDYYVIKDVVNDRPIYKIFGHEISINNEVENDHFIFGNLKLGYVLNIQQDMKLQVLNEKYASNGAKGILYNMYFDGTVKNKYALRIRKPKAVVKSK